MLSYYCGCKVFISKILCFLLAPEQLNLPSMLQSKMLQLELILRFPSLGNGLVFLFGKLLAFGLMYSLLHPNSARLNSHMIPALIVPDKKLVNGVYTSVFSRDSD